MKSILPEVRRQEEGKGGQGQPEAGAAGSGDSSVSAGGRGRTGKGGKGQAGSSGAVHAKGHLAGKGGKGSGWGRQWPQPQRSFRQSPLGSPRQVSSAVRAEVEREVRRQQAARYEALAYVEHQRRCCQPTEQGCDLPRFAISVSIFFCSLNRLPYAVGHARAYTRCHVEF